MVEKIKPYLDDFISLLYPHVCQSCGQPLVKQEQHICLKCTIELPRTNFHFVSPNPVEKLFWGRVKIEKGTAHFFYRKGSKFQKLLHKLKYNGNHELGVELGRLLGADIAQLNYFEGVDYLVPVPLHPKKERKRGYNQSLMIAKGLQASIDKPIVQNNLLRRRFTDSQTKRGRYARWENVSELFQLTDAEMFKDKHVLLIDDVITTGSTIEACANAIKNETNAKVSVAAIGFTSL